MRFPLPAHPTANPSATAARFITPHGIMAWATSDVNGRLPLPVKCEVRKLRVQLASAPGGTTAWIIELYVNGAAVEGAKIEIKGGATEGQWVGVLKLAAQDNLSIRLTPVGEPAVASAGAGSAFTTTFETEGNVFFFGAGGNPSVSNAEATNNFPYGINSAAWLAGGEEFQVRAPIPGKFKLVALAADLSGSPGAAKSYTVAARVNGATNALPVKIEGSSAAEGLATGSVQLNPGDTLLLRCTPAGTPTARSVRVGIAVEAENLGETFALGANFNTESATQINYTYVDTLRTAAWSSGHAGIWQLRPSGLTFKNLYVEIGSPPEAGKGRLYQFTMKEVPQPLEVEIKGAATKGSDTTHSFVTNGERLDFRSFPLTSPAIDFFGAHWGFVVIVPQPAEIEANLSGSGSLAVDLRDVASIAANIGGSGALNAGADTPANLSAALSGSGNLEAGVDTPASIAAHLSGAGSLSADLSVPALIEASLEGSGDLSVGLSACADLSASLSGAGELSAGLEVLVTLIPGHGVAGQGSANRANADVASSGSASAGVGAGGSASAKVTGNGSAIIGGEK